MGKISRRNLLKSAGAVGAVLATPAIALALPLRNLADQWHDNYLHWLEHYGKTPWDEYATWHLDRELKTTKLLVQGHSDLFQYKFPWTPKAPPNIELNFHQYKWASYSESMFNDMVRIHGVNADDVRSQNLYQN